MRRFMFNFTPTGIQPPVSFARGRVFREDVRAGRTEASCDPPADCGFACIGEEWKCELMSFKDRDTSAEEQRAASERSA